MRRKLWMAVLAMGGVGLLSAGENLLPNGDFEAGKDIPEHWEPADGLTSFWIMDRNRGRILKLDTRIDRAQVLAWWELRKKNPAAQPPVPVIPKEPLLSVGAFEGTCIDSDFITVKPGQNYKLTVDYKGGTGMFVWIKGFMLHPKRGIHMDCYQTRLAPSGDFPGEWRTYSIGFNPTARMPKTDKMKVRIYAYWPPGICYFDRIRIEAITPEEMAALVAERSRTSPPR